MANKKTKEIVTPTIERDGSDEIMFDSIRGSSKIEELCVKPIEEGLVQDAFTSFYTHSPKIDATAQFIQKGLLETLMGLPEFQGLRDGTMNDEIGSALGSVQFSPQLIQQYYEIKKKIEQRKAEQKKQNTGQEPGKDKGDEKGDGEGEESFQDQLGDKNMGALRQSLRRAIEDAQEKTDEWADICSQWGINKGELKTVSFAERFQLAEQLTKQKHLKSIADLMGRFKNIVNSSPSLVPMHGVDEIVDIGISSDVNRILPTEIVKLMETPEVFYADMLEGKLQSYNLKNVEDLGKGPIIVCLDISGSMTGPREEWSKAVVLSLMHLAEKQNRAFGFIAFESVVADRRFWPKGLPASLKDKIAVASTSTTGGTNFYEPLKAAFEMRAKEPGLKPADIVFITDGECQLGDVQLAEILAEKKKTEVRVYGIAINDGYNGSSGTTLASFADQIAVVNSTGDISHVKNLIQSTASGSLKKVS